MIGLLHNMLLANDLSHHYFDVVIQDWGSHDAALCRDEVSLNCSNTSQQANKIADFEKMAIEFQVRGVCHREKCSMGQLFTSDHSRGCFGKIGLVYYGCRHNDDNLNRKQSITQLIDFLGNTSLVPSLKTARVVSQAMDPVPRQTQLVRRPIVPVGILLHGHLID